VSEPATDSAFGLSEDEAVAVAETAAAFAVAVPEGRDAPYRLLAATATAGEVPADQMATLEQICVLALETGKARQLGSAETERLLMAVYRRTPGGTAIQSETSDVNKVLSQFVGRTLQSARLTCRMPGRYHLDLTVDGFDVTIAIAPEGLEVRSLQTG
jgi:hypothetical protein